MRTSRRLAVLGLAMLSLYLLRVNGGLRWLRESVERGRMKNVVLLEDDWVPPAPSPEGPAATPTPTAEPEPVHIPEADAGEEIPWEKPGFVRSDNGQIWRDTANTVAGIDTPRTQAIYGKLAKDKANRMDPVPGLECSSFKVRAFSDYAVIALSSLTDEPIENSDHMLLSAIGRVRNTGAQFDGNMLIENGSAPVMSELIEAELAVRTERDDLQVWGISPEGYYTGRIDSTLEDGWLKFRIGECCGAVYYLITAE